MDREIQKYYEGQFSMMATQGWADLMEDLQKFRTSINELSTVVDEQSLFFRKGQLDVLDLVLSRKQACEKAYEEIQDATDI
jgi:hypothetical protein